MTAPDVAVLDYGVGNLRSVFRAFEQVGACVRFIHSAEEIRESSRLVIPGVGAFGSCMGQLANRDLVDAIVEGARSGLQILGICVGMQMLFDHSEEFGYHAGLGLLPGAVRRIQLAQEAKLPHVGWASLLATSAARDWDGSILEQLNPGVRVYFVHSYTAEPKPGHRLADADYAGTRVSAVVRNGNVHGVQFHPERSGDVGLRILDSFARLPART